MIFHAVRKMKKPESFTKDSSQIAKGVAIIWLLIYHLFGNRILTTEMGVDYRPLSWDGLMIISSFGHICVALFIFLSAYGISKGIFEKNTSLEESMRQALKRIAKLVAGFLALYVSVWVVFGWTFSFTEAYGSAPQGFIYMLTDATGLADIFGTPSMNQTWWYMKLAYALALFVPLIAAFTKKAGYTILGIALLVPVIFSVNYDATTYLFTIALGVAAAYGDWINKLMKLKVHIVLKWLIGIVGTVALIIIRDNSVVQESFIHIVDAVCSLFIVWTSAQLLSTVPVLRECLAFVGKHSLNIFLIHSFFYLIVFMNVVYYFKPAIASLVILTALSLGYSVVLELIKKYVVIGFNKVRGKRRK